MNGKSFEAGRKQGDTEGWWRATILWVILFAFVLWVGEAEACDRTDHQTLCDRLTQQYKECKGGAFTNCGGYKVILRERMKKVGCI